MAKKPRKKRSGMMATLTFELPECEEELANAVQARKWQQLVRDILNSFIHGRDTSQLEEQRAAYRSAVLIIQESLKDAGLTIVSTAALEQMRLRCQKWYAKQLDIEMKKNTKEDDLPA